MSTADAARVRLAIDADAVAATLADLIAVPTVAGAESAGQERVAEWMARAGMAVDAWTADAEELRAHPLFSEELPRSEHRGLVGAIGSGDGPALLLDGHVDVVAPGDGWTSDPFAPQVRDGRMVGRGACDAKAGLAAALHAVTAIVDAGLELRGRLLVASVVGEEDGGAGTLATLLHGVRADGAIVLEPTELSIAPAVAGALTFRVDVAGRAAHGCLREQGVSAIEKALPLHRTLLELEAHRNEGAADGVFGWLRLPFAICMGRIAGGDSANDEAAWLTVEGRYGIAPGEDVARARGVLEDAVAQAAAGDPWLAAHRPVVTWTGGQWLPAQTALDDPLVVALRAAAPTAAVRGMPYGCDAGLLAEVGGMPTVVYGPGDIRDAHRPDESVPIAEVVACAEALARTAITFCGVAL